MLRNLGYPKIKKTWHSINKYISDIQYSKEDWNITKISEDIKFIYCSAQCKQNSVAIQFGLSQQEPYFAEVAESIPKEMECSV